jgi:hypothetical protein
MVAGMVAPLPPMAFPDWSGFGPKLLALDEGARRFVWAYHMVALNEGKENAPRLPGMLAIQITRTPRRSGRIICCSVRTSWTR